MDKRVGLTQQVIWNHRAQRQGSRRRPVLRPPWDSAGAVVSSTPHTSMAKVLPTPASRSRQGGVS